MRNNIATGGPWEDRYGYSRAVGIGSHLWVSGCTSLADGRFLHEGDAAGQARAAFGVALQALQSGGFARTDVVRTRMFVVDLPDNGDAVATVHGELFGDIRPASSLLGVTALVDPRMLVEVEVECYRAPA